MAAGDGCATPVRVIVCPPLAARPTGHSPRAGAGARATVASTAAENSGLEEVITDLDQNPDFYVWLASGDADLLAME